MGWQGDDPKHEGYTVGLVRVGEYSFRELTRADEATCPKGGIELAFVQVACECGWRSPRMYPPMRARWFPCCVELEDDEADELAFRIWKRHIACEETPPGWLVPKTDPAAIWENYPRTPESLSGRFLSKAARDVLLERRIGRAARGSSVRREMEPGKLIDLVAAAAKRGHVVPLAATSCCSITWSSDAKIVERGKGHGWVRDGRCGVCSRLLTAPATP